MIRRARRSSGAERRRLTSFAVLVLCCAAACGDPQLSLTFNIRDPYRGRIASVSVQVIQPTVAEPFTCDDIAFRRVEPAVIALAKVNEINTDSLKTPINELSRTSSKLFWVDGLDQEKRRLVTGCGKMGEIKKDTKLEIVAEPVARVRDPAGVSLSPPRPPTEPVVIVARDALDQPLADVPARWSIEGAAGEGSSGQTKSDAMGNIAITPQLPRRNGPFVLDVRVRWADRAPVLLSGVVRPDAQLVELSGRALAFRSGAIGPNKEQGFAALLADTVLGGVKVLLVYRAPNRMLTMKTSVRITGSPILGLIDYSGAARDRVVVVSATSWTEVSADGVLVARPFTPAGASAPLRLLTTGPCGSADPTRTRALIELGDGLYAQYTPDGGQPMDMLRLNDPAAQRADVVASGCVSDQADKLTRTWAIVIGTGIGVFAATRAEPTGTFQFANWLALSEGIAIAPMNGRGRKQIFGAQLSVNDIVVSRATLEHQPDSLALKVEGLDSIPNVPTQTAAGDIDGDGAADVVAVFDRGLLTARRPALWAVLGREHGGRRIAGDVELAPATPPLREPVLMVLDLDGDGIDDIVLGEVASSPVARASRAQIYYMGR